ncbi:ATP11-domain-containing protein [Fistulina hepatica ATCC 64428]|uniref:ATP11-domain-containing protein n=1 Tax=Fistulina hepatica ATCC 64428 TaxID=1128425 RepID=A0A0D7A9H9_9AGAR|nr:ATP11-domain-containing protein [Fistulina hepatica ATCC 64428]
MFRSSLTLSSRGEKYAQKLQQYAEQRNVDLETLKAEARKKFVEAERRKLEAEAALLRRNVASNDSPLAKNASPRTSPAATAVRKDNSPVKPLSSILNLERILDPPHTSAQISQIWTSYHELNGKAYLSAAIPLDKYERMAANAQRYPTFVAPLARPPPVEAPVSADKAPQDQHEFFFLQWDFHEAPPLPSADPFAAPVYGRNPRTSTVIFTPLQEYKHRQAFATPFLVLTHYTDLVHSHGLVLLRGEITPSTSGAMDTHGAPRYLLKREEAQALAMSVQRFYLWDDALAKDATNLVETFHTRPDNFKWEELIRVAQTVA